MVDSFYQEFEIWLCRDNGFQGKGPLILARMDFCAQVHYSYVDHYYMPLSSFVSFAFFPYFSPEAGPTCQRYTGSLCRTVGSIGMDYVYVDTSVASMEQYESEIMQVYSECQ